MQKYFYSTPDGLYLPPALDANVLPEIQKELIAQRNAHKEFARKKLHDTELFYEEARLESGVLQGGSILIASLKGYFNPTIINSPHEYIIFSGLIGLMIFFECKHYILRHEKIQWDKYLNYIPIESNLYQNATPEEKTQIDNRASEISEKLFPFTESQLMKDSSIFERSSAIFLIRTLSGFVTFKCE
jgi:hypothetical protein